MKGTFKQHVLVEPDNCAPYVEILTSKRPITIQRAWKFYEERDGFNEERDSITFIDAAMETISLDS